MKEMFAFEHQISLENRCMAEISTYTQSVGHGILSIRGGITPFLILDD